MFNLSRATTKTVRIFIAAKLLLLVLACTTDESPKVSTLRVEVDVASGQDKSVTTPSTTTDPASATTDPAPTVTDPASATTDPAPATTAAPRSTSRQAHDPVKPSHIIFVGSVRARPPLDCGIFATSKAPHRQPPRQLNDRTDYRTRHKVRFAVLETLQGPKHFDDRGPLRGAKAKAPLANVAFALTSRTFSNGEQGLRPNSYGKPFCQDLNRLLSAKFVVVHGYPVYVDRGNSRVKPWNAIGTDPGKANAGFDTQAKARAYALTLVKPVSAATE